MKRIALFATSLLTASTAFAQSTITQSPAYQECTALASTNPTQALAKADAWLKIDTGIAAQHCRAMSLYGLRRFPEAGDALTAVRDAVSVENIGLRSYLARQAARAYMNANRTDQSFTILSTQITEIAGVKSDNAAAAKLTADLLLDRARLNVTYGKLDEATKDLDHAVSLTPINEDVLMERASVFEKLGDKPLAQADAEAVLKINGSNAAAKELLQRLGGLPKPAAGLTAPSASAATANQPVFVTAPAPAAVEGSPVPKPTAHKASSKAKPKAKVTPQSEAP